MTALDGWENFYVIVGSSAGALIGLQFVVLTLVAENPLARSPAMGSTFGAPTIVHFSAVLLLSAIVSAPWHGIAAVAVLLGLVGVSGITYSVIVARRLRTQTEYKPVFEDRLFHVLLPFAAYLTLAVSVFEAPSHIGEALFGIGAAALLLLFIGIHNAWDGVAYHLFTKK
ncbi:MAG: hypothetical protein DME76_15785 [Verrucomicrobia bacterium]|nr:MAG: hypothetical protein DME76_15785 [Verrucomicrobiota bacterium]